MRRAINVVVLLLILAVAGGLLAVSIHKVRSAAAQTECCNSVRQLATALHNHASALDTFPQAAVPHPNLVPDQRLSWLASIGPYVESTDLYRGVDWKKGWSATENRHLSTVWLKYLECPAQAGGWEKNAHVSSSYIGLAGLGDDAASLALGHPGAGCFGYERVWSPGLQKYAASHLIAIMETSQLQGVWSQGGPATVRGLPDETPTLGKSAPFGGLHQGGTNAGMADASCRFLSDSIDPGVLRKMVTFAGSRRAAEEDEP